MGEVSIQMDILRGTNQVFVYFLCLQNERVIEGAASSVYVCPFSRMLILFFIYLFNF